MNPMSHPKIVGNGRSLKRALRKAILGLAACLLVAGCHTTPAPPAGEFACVEIRGSTPGQICSMAREVFRENGYDAMPAAANHLVFEKKGSTLNNIAYGNWLDAAVWVRVKVAVVPMVEQVWRIQCHACLLRDRGATTEEEVTGTSLQHHPYQKLLEEVQQRLTAVSPLAGNSQ